jgi:hypothetical protein
MSARVRFLDSPREFSVWGLSLQFWQSVVSWANIIALAGGVLTGAALFVSAWVASNIADVIQQDADRQIAEARTRGDEARAEAAKAVERASAADERAAALSKEAAEARVKLAEIENLTTWRRLRADQREQLIHAISDHLPPLIIVQYEQADPEAAIFAVDLDAALKAAGAQDVRRSGNSVYIGGEPTFGLLYKASPQFDPAVVKTAFAKAGYPLTEQPALPLPFGVGSLGALTNPSEKRVIDLFLYVGHKPPAQ